MIEVSCPRWLDGLKSCVNTPPAIQSADKSKDRVDITHNETFAPNFSAAQSEPNQQISDIEAKLHRVELDMQAKLDEIRSEVLSRYSGPSDERTEEV